MLGLRVPLGDGETPTSFCSRLAMRNQCADARDFCLDMGIQFQKIIDGDPGALMVLAELGGVEIEDLSRNAIRHVSGRHHFELRGQALRKSMLQRERLRVCPACIADDRTRWPSIKVAAPFGRVIWNLLPMRTCPVHGIALVDLGFSGTRGEGQDFARVLLHTKARLEEPVRRKPSGLELYLAARLEGVLSTPMLDQLPFYAAAKLTEVIGAVELFGPRVRLRALNDAQWSEAGDVGFAITDAGRDGVCAFLDRQTERFWSRRTSDGPQALFGRLYEWLAHESKDKAYDGIRELAREHILANIPVAPGQEIFGQAVDRRRLHSLHSASQATAQHPNRLRKLLVAGGIISSMDEHISDHRIVFPATPTVEDFLIAAADTMCPSQVCRYINAPPVQVEVLVREQLIVPLVTPTDSLHAAFVRRHLDEFLNRLLATVTQPPDGLHTIPSAAKRAGCSAANVVRLLLDGKLTRVGCRDGVEGYMSVAVDPAEVEMFLPRPNRDHLSIHDVSRATGWGVKAIRALVGHGYLPSVAALNPVNHQPQRLVTRQDLKAFTDIYMSLHTLKIRMRRQIYVIKEQAEAAGARPAFPVDEVQATFYRRADLPFG